MRLYIGLVHYPVYNRNNDRIASAITTFDLHDLSRLSRTYGVKGFFVVTPLEDQQRLAARVLNHWITGYGADYNRFRKEALELARISPSIETASAEIKELEGESPLLMITDASRQKDSLTYSRAREILATGKTVFLLFGTAWGLVSEIVEGADYILDPVEGPSDYNHLSVRAAAAIILDRLAGDYR